METRADHEPQSQPERERYAPAPKGKDGRGFPRFRYRTLAIAIIHPMADEDFATIHCYVLTRDLSRNGVSFMHPKKLAAGQRIELAFPDGKEVTVRVLNSRQLGPRCFLMGCKFIVVPDFDGGKRLADLNGK